MGEPAEIALCGILSGKRSSSPGAMDEAHVLEAAVEHRVHSLLADRFRTCSEKSRVFLQDQLRREALIDRMQLMSLRQILAALADASVFPILFKGMPLAYMYYA